MTHVIWIVAGAVAAIWLASVVVRMLRSRGRGEPATDAEHRPSESTESGSPASAPLCAYRDAEVIAQLVLMAWTIIFVIAASVEGSKIRAAFDPGGTAPMLWVASLAFVWIVGAAPVAVAIAAFALVADFRKGPFGRGSSQGEARQRQST